MVYKDYKGTTMVTDAFNDPIFICVQDEKVFTSTITYDMSYTPEEADELAAALKAHARAARKAKVKAGGK